VIAHEYEIIIVDNVGFYSWNCRLFLQFALYRPDSVGLDGDLLYRTRRLDYYVFDVPVSVVSIW
jgi:hypothetical protein